MSRVPYNKLLTNLACSSRTGEYWPSVVFVRTSRCSVRIVTTSGQYSPVRPSRSVSKRLVTVKILRVQMHDLHQPLKARTKCAIEFVRLTSSNSQIQNKRATKGFILIRHKRYQIYICLQLSSSIASFVWKPAHFELRSYGSA